MEIVRNFEFQYLKSISSYTRFFEIIAYNLVVIFFGTILRNVFSDVIYSNVDYNFGRIRDGHGTGIIKYYLVCT